MSELNEITKKLIAQGYTRDQTPPGMKPWNAFYGGWEYSRDSQNAMVFETPCGLLAKGSHWNSGYMSYMGVDWTIENGNPVITCPKYSQPDCDLRNPLLRSQGLESRIGRIRQCDCHRTERPYDYDHSLDKVRDDVDSEADELWKVFSDSHGGRACRQHAYYDRAEKKWHMNYDPWRHCNGGCRYCTILGKELSQKNANVYYDLKTVWTDKGEGLIPDEQKTSITKGIKLLKHQISEDICEAIVKTCKPDIQRFVNLQRHYDIYMNGTKYEVLNLRAERRETRDLKQDLADIAAGIEVVHKSDAESENKQQKSDKRRASQEKRTEKMKRLIAEKGYSGLEEIDKRRANKLFGKMEIRQIEKAAAKAKSSAQPGRDQQINLFSMEGTE